MKFGKVALAASAVSLAITPAAFAADRASAPVDGESAVGSGGNGLLIGALFTVLAVGLTVALAGDNDPVSP